MAEMTEERFAHMLKLSAVYIPVLRSRALFENLEDMDDADRHNTLNCLETVADTFVEMQRRLGAKPKFRRAALTQAEGEK